MDDLLSYTSSINIRKQLNVCRLFLQITFLLEITDIDGTHLIQGILHGDNKKMLPTTLHWPTQGSPDSSTWKVWSTVIIHMYCVNSHSGILRKENKLGHWLTSNSSRTQSYQFTYSPNHQEVNEHSKQGIKQWFASEVQATIFSNAKSAEQNVILPQMIVFPLKKITRSE